jgi:hypothetical protein
MNSIRYPKYIFIIGIVLIIITVIYYIYNNLNKTIEGVTTGESDNIPSTSPTDATKTIKQQIEDFTQGIYDSVKFNLTSKTKQSENKTIELLKQMDEKHKIIELPTEIDPEIKKQIADLNDVLIIQLNKFKYSEKYYSDTGVSVEILPEIKTKIRDIVNTYL